MVWSTTFVIATEVTVSEKRGLTGAVFNMGEILQATVARNNEQIQLFFRMERWFDAHDPDCLLASKLASHATGQCDILSPSRSVLCAHTGVSKGRVVSEARYG
jgi:hypothetical protein